MKERRQYKIWTLDMRIELPQYERSYSQTKMGAQLIGKVLRALCVALDEPDLNLGILGAHREIHDQRLNFDWVQSEFDALTRRNF